MKKKIITAFLSAIMILVMGTTVFASSGSWQYDGYGWWYEYDQGGYAASRWEDIDGSWYHFNYNGYMDTGWIYDGAWYYMNPDGTMATGWVFDGLNWYYMGTSGAMQTGWINDGTDWYFLNANGVMQTGWFWDGTWYYLYLSGIMDTGWVYDNGNKYDFDETTGIMVRGEVDINGENPAFGDDGISISSGIGSEAEMAAQKKLDQISWDLYAAFKWSVDASYDINITGTTVATAALSIFRNGVGDSAAKASAFCMMARVLGYDAYVITGRVPSSVGGYREHAWVEIVVGGITYVCDPDFEAQTGTNGYMINYGQSGTWQYISGQHMPE